MIEALKHDVLAERVGGQFKLAALIQKRWLELLQGARPMVEPEGRTDMEIVIQEILENKITLVTPEKSADEDAGRS
jgi:DNA-directed RNA polymerase subunit omega